MQEYPINPKRLTETFVELIRINSPSFSEREIGNVLAGKLERAGCRVEMQEYGRSFNLVALKKGDLHDASPLLLSGHMDTIEPTEGIAFRLENDRIVTTGNTVLGADDKSALAQIVEAVTALGESGIPHGDIEIVFSSAEERGLVGAGNLDFSKLRSRHALVLDSSGSVGNLVIAAPTHITYEMQVTGRPAHAGIEPEKGLSAIRVASEIVSAVPDGRIDPETTANVGRISGGTATNVVPKEAIINGELRGHSASAIEKTKERIFGTARTIAQKHGAELRISEIEEYRSFRIDRNDPFLAFLGRIFEENGIMPSFVVTGGGSDANIFNHRGIEAVNISTGMQKVHSTDEFIYLKDLHDGCRIVFAAAAEIHKASALRLVV
ncbi:MAG TPA: M20/M25/M40 family metallo-hydrolase [Dissulfurispiraceae bacterium]